MNWIKTTHQIPEEDELVLICDKNGEVWMGTIVDINRSLRERATKRKDKYPVRYFWRENSSCCYADNQKLEVFPYWAQRPEGPVNKIVCPDWCKSPHVHTYGDSQAAIATKTLIEILKMDKK